MWLEAPGSLNELFVPDVKRPPETNEFAVNTPSSRSVPVPQRESQSDDCRLRALARGLPARLSGLSREKSAQLTNNQDPWPGTHYSDAAPHLGLLHIWGCSSGQPLAPEDEAGHRLETCTMEN